MFRSLLFFAFFLPLLVSADANKSAAIISEGKKFFAWLESNQTQFKDWRLKEEDDIVAFPDQSRISLKELEELISKEPAELVASLRKKGVKVAILCDSEPDRIFDRCSQTVPKGNTLKRVSSLEGLFRPQENTIYIRSSSSKATLLHEYIHYLQFQNRNEVAGKRYKAERIDLQESIDSIMLAQIQAIEKLEKSGKTAEIKKHLPLFKEANELMMAFSPWQDLIDERPIFVLYLRYADRLALPKEDVSLAKRNLRAICERFSGRLPKEQCALAN